MGALKSLQEIFNSVVGDNNRLNTSPSYNKEFRNSQTLSLPSKDTFYKVTISGPYQAVLIGLNNKSAKFTISLKADGSNGVTFKAGDMTPLLSFHSSNEIFYISSDTDSVTAQLMKT